MAKKHIPETVKKEVDGIVATFNRRIIKDPNYFYMTRYRGEYLYLDRYDYGKQGPICRLKYNGEMNNWDFAIYKYSNEKYDPEEWMFPGSEYVDGTIEGAIKAGMSAYP